MDFKSYNAFIFAVSVLLLMTTLLHQPNMPINIVSKQAAERLKEECDNVIVTSPPLASVHDNGQLLSDITEMSSIAATTGKMLFLQRSIKILFFTAA